MQIPNEFKCTPVIYAVSGEYQIFVPVSKPTVMWVEIDGKAYYDDSNGILRSDVAVHKMHVPCEVLDRAKKYTVCYRVIIERKPYYSEATDILRYESEFRPVSGDKIRLYQIADAHNRVEEPIACAQKSGEGLDLLILNGDIPNHSGDVKYFDAIHEIAAGITRGEIPVVFSRGNHDMRGVAAEKLEYYTPTDCGRSYFTFRLGRLWGIVLDAAEDKPDSHIAYGNMNCCHDFRLRETEFIRDVIRRADTEYLADGVEWRIVISHNPFAHTPPEPFNIEAELFGEWAELLRKNVKPHLMLSGHVHDCYVTRRGEVCDDKGIPCPVVVGSRVTEEEYICTRVEISEEKADIFFTDPEGKIHSRDCVIFSEEHYDT